MIDLDQLRRRRQIPANVIVWPREWQRESPVLTIEIDARIPVLRLAQVCATQGWNFNPTAGGGLRLEPAQPEETTDGQ